MKKTVVSILLAAVLVTLTACGGGKSGSIENPFAAKPTLPGVQSQAPADTPPPETQAPAASNDTGGESDLTMGVYTESTHTYENEFIGIGCKLDEDWEVFDAAAIAELNGMVIDAMTDEALAEQMESGGYVQPFYAQAEDGFMTVNITVENLGLLYGSMLDEKDYAELAVKQLPAALESLGLSDVTTEVTSASFAGGQHTAIVVNGTMQDVEFHELMVCVKVGRYIANVTAASYFTDVTGEILDMFYAL